MELQLVKKTDYWEERAIKVHSNFRWCFPDEINMYDICWKYRVKIKPLDPNYIDSEICYESIKHLNSFSVLTSRARRGTIYLKPDLQAIEKKLLLAEEFCHCYSHYSSQITMDKHAIAKQENQAKRMAAYLLMPSKFLKHVYTSAISEPMLISDIADYFVVNEDFAHYRLELTFQHRVDGFITLRNRLGSIELI